MGREADERRDSTEPDAARWITVAGARINNLRDVSVRVPKYRLTVFTGVSGSGKSSLVFDTIAAEAERLVAESYPVFLRNRLPQHPPVDADELNGLTFTRVVDQRRFNPSTRSTVGTASDIAALLRVLFSRIGEPSAGYSPAYSFNDPRGMCPRCEGLGAVDDIDLTALLDTSKSLREGAVRFPTFAPGTYRWKRLMHAGLADTDLPLSRLPQDVMQTLLYAQDLRLENPDPQYPKSGLFEGIVPRLRNSYLRKRPSRITDEESAALNRVVTRSVCPECDGTRLNQAARLSTIDGRSIADWSAMPVSDLQDVAANVQSPSVKPLLDALTQRLEALTRVGLGYLSLDRPSHSLSGGEAQRVKIVRHLGSALSDVTYVFDEPSTGLHPHDVHRLLELLAKLRDARNTVLVVEHHPSVLGAADHLVELGPGGGARGGRVLYEGPPEAIAASDTPTGRILRAPLRLRRTVRTAHDHVTIRNAHAYNLRDVTVDVPLGVLTVVTGVAGSGKSTLMTVELPRQHPSFTVVEQAPLRGGVRSTPITVLGVAESIRGVFSDATGLAPSWFSPNARGACPVCKGKGVIVTDLAFLDDVQTVCDACGGSRFNDTTLAAKLDDCSIADVLAMTAEESSTLFVDHPDISNRLRWLERVGLDYMSIGRSLDTFSGGERQRLLLARHLGEAGDLSALRIVLDEPTAGLHATDVDSFLQLLDELIDAGTTVVAIEHNLRVAAHADHIIDVGPGAGFEGGAVVFEGAPSDLVGSAVSITGRHLAAATT